MNIIENYDKNKVYQFGCVISYKDRSNLVQETFQSINNSFIPDNLLFILIDDGSEENIVPNLKHDHILIRKDKSYGISHSLVMGWDIIYNMNIEYMMNVDSDVNVSVNWISVLNNTLHSYKSNCCIVTGYNGAFPDQYSNHPIQLEHKYYRIKKSIGGINLFFHKNLYTDIIRKSLTLYDIIPSNVLDSVNYYGSNPHLDPRNNYKGWDWSLSYLCTQYNIPIVCSKQSAIQHTGSNGISSDADWYEKSYDYKNECVPKIIHQLWKDKDIPDHLKLMQQSVLDHHSGYQYMFWTDKDLDGFLQVYYPGVWNFYTTGFEYIIQKIDFIRLLLVYHYGGIYIDLDSLCIKNIEDILGYPCSFVDTKKHESFSNKYYPLIMNNAFISAEKNNDFIKTILLNIINYQDPIDYKEYCSFNPLYTKILKSAGPLCITDSYLSYTNKSLVNLLPNRYYQGLDYDRNLSPEQIIDYGLDYGKQIDDCRFVHMHESSWWKQNGVAIEPPKNNLFDNQNLDEKRRMAIIELISV